jgi:hypothetical protein
MAYTATILPYRVCFIETTSEFYFVFDWIMNGFFILDIIVSFFSAYHDEDNVLVTNHKYIVSQYLQTWFAIDVLSVFPFNEVLSSSVPPADGEI